MKEFELVLSDAQQSYLVKPVGKAVIEDQQAVVKMVRTEQGEEGTKRYFIRTWIIQTGWNSFDELDGSQYHRGWYLRGKTADVLTLIAGLTLRVMFANGSQKSSFSVKTLEDTRYELPKTVVIKLLTRYIA